MKNQMINAADNTITDHVLSLLLKIKTIALPNKRLVPMPIVMEIAIAQQMIRFVKNLTAMNLETIAATAKVATVTAIAIATVGAAMITEAIGLTAVTANVHA